MNHNWEKTVLGNLCRFQAGGAFPKAEQGATAGDLPFIKVSDMALPENSKRIVAANNWVSAETAQRMKLKLVPAGAIAFAKIGEGLKAERLRRITRPTAMDNNMMAAVPKTGAVDERFLLYLLEDVHIASWAEGSALPYLRQKDLAAIPVKVPALSQQRTIAGTLGALDDKIESNRRARALLRDLGLALFQSSIGGSSQTRTLNELTYSIARGVTPKYADGNPSAPHVINQKCIRDGWVSLGAARRMEPRDVAPARRVGTGDILVNSTGTGTLGRLARWHGGQTFADSHVSVVKPNPTEVAPIILAYALFGRQSDIEDLATGSTGQTELSPTRLGSLPVVIPVGALRGLSSELLAIEDRAEQLAVETTRLETLRDSLLPELLSGRVSVEEELAA